MADLEGAAGDTLSRLKELVAQVEEAHQKFSALGDKVNGVADQVDEDWSRLAEQVNTFLQAAQEQQQRLGTEVEESTQALSDLDAALVEAGNEAHGELEGAGAQVTGFAEEVTGTEPTVSGLAESVDSVFEALSQQAAQVQGALEQALQTARDFLQDDVVNTLQEMQQEIHDRGDVIAQAFQECADDLHASYQDWAAGLEEVDATVEEAFNEANEHLEQNVDLALDECLDRHTEALDEFTQQIDDLQGVLDEVVQAVQAGGQVSAEAVEQHEGEMETTHSGLEAVQAKLTEIKTLLAQYTFVQM